MKADRARLLAIAVAGIVVAHAADYALAFPDPGRRGRVLAATGHGYWPVAVLVATAGGAVALAIAARRGWRGGGAPASVPASAARLATTQVVLFGVLEFVERLAVGGPPVAYVGSTQFALGVVLQVAVAITAAVLLGGLERAASRLASSTRRPRRADRAPLAWVRPADRDLVQWAGVAGDARAPPSSLPV